MTGSVFKLYDLFDGDTTWTIAALNEDDARFYARENCHGPDVNEDEITIKEISPERAALTMVSSADEDEAPALLSDLLKDVTDTCLLACDDPGM
jgi:hypothetical protein